jgi:hypothetical protein
MRAVSPTLVQHAQRFINSPLVHRLNVELPPRNRCRSRCVPSAVSLQNGADCELGKLGKLVRGTRKKSAARELGKLVPPPIGGDEFQDEFVHVKKINNVRTSSGTSSAHATTAADIMRHQQERGLRPGSLPQC